MRNNFWKNLILTVFAVLFCTADSCFAHPVFPPEVKTLVVKFTFAMGGVVIFSIIISAGLSIYNKFFVASGIKDYKLSKDSLRALSDKDEAIFMYIAKNRLR